MPAASFNEEQRREFGLPRSLAAGSTGAAGPLLTLDLSQGTSFLYKVNATLFIGEPINPPQAGTEFNLILVQDGASGNFAVTWAGCWRDAPNWSGGGALGTRASAKFCYDGNSYQYVGGSSVFAASNFNVSSPTGGLNFASDISAILTNPAPTPGAITMAGVASTVTNNTIVSLTPTIGAVTLAGAAPTVSAINQTLIPGVGAVTIVGLLPTVHQP